MPQAAVGGPVLSSYSVSYSVSLSKTEQGKPKHVERNPMIGLWGDRGVDRETIDERDDDVRQQLDRHTWTKLQ